MKVNALLCAAKGKSRFPAKYLCINPELIQPFVKKN